MLLSKWKLRLLGGLSIEQADHTVSAFQSHKKAMLLALLGYCCPRPRSREEIIEILWPDVDDDCARNSLRVAINSIRRQIEPPGTASGTVLRASRSELSLNSRCVVVDVREFDRSLMAADSATYPKDQLVYLQQAVMEYDGSLLPGFYEDWVLLERERLHQAYTGALCRLSGLLVEQKEYAAALNYALRAVSAEPLDEAHHTLAIRLYLASGRPAEALRHYQEMSDLFWRELQIAPSAELSSLVKLPGSTHASVQTAFRSSRRPAPDSGTFQSTNSNLGSHGAPVRTAHSRPARTPSLPPSSTPFFGRERELEQLERLLSDPDIRLLTLTGSGGVGKTRLSLELAGRAACRGDGQFWFVSVVELSDPGQLMEKMASVLGAKPGVGTEPYENVVAALSQRRTTLVLDNFEHLVAGGAEMLMGLLDHLPLLSCIVTSRQTLAIPGEQEFPVPPLPVPAEGCDHVSLAGMDCMRLFLDRARRVRPDFQVTERNAAPLAAVIRQLEGIPLALELAAGWAKLLSPAEMLQQLSNRLAFLVSRQRGLPERHRAIRATLDWSFRLLNPELRRFFGHLSVFRGGCTLHAVSEVCETPDSLACLCELASQSLLQVQASCSTTRYRMLETVRDFALAQISEYEFVDLRGRHAAYFVQLGERASKDMAGPNQSECLMCLDAEQSNLQAALEWCLEFNPGDALRLSYSLWRYWHFRGLIREGTIWLERSLDQNAHEKTPLRIRALNAVGILRFAQGREKEAQAAYEESLLLARALNDPRGVGSALSNLAALAHERGDDEQARVAYEESLALFRAIGHASGIVQVTLNLGGIALELGDLSGARQLLRECLEINGPTGNPWTVAAALHNLAEIDLTEGRLPEARSGFEDSLARWVSLGETHTVACTLRSLGHILQRQGLAERAVWLFGAADTISQRCGAAIRHRARYELDLDFSRKALSPQTWSKSWDAGHKSGLEAIVAELIGTVGQPSAQASDAGGGQAA